jgi:uncharacterized repeat protein (TIGR01451 family)
MPKTGEKTMNLRHEDDARDLSNAAKEPMFWSAFAKTFRFLALCVLTAFAPSMSTAQVGETFTFQSSPNNFTVILENATGDIVTITSAPTSPSCVTVLGSALRPFASATNGGGACDQPNIMTFTTSGFDIESLFFNDIDDMDGAASRDAFAASVPGTWTSPNPGSPGDTLSIFPLTGPVPAFINQRGRFIAAGAQSSIVARVSTNNPINDSARFVLDTPVNTFAIIHDDVDGARSAFTSFNLSAIPFTVFYPPEADDELDTPAVAGVPTVIDVLDGDTDRDGTLVPASVTIVGSAGPGQPLVVPGQGTWSVDTTTGEITFTPEPGFLGTPTPISYTVDDNTGRTSNEATVSLLVGTTLAPELDVTKSFGTAVAGPGGTVSVPVTITATNTGDSDLDDLQITDNLADPANFGTAFQSISGPVGISVTDNAGVSLLGNDTAAVAPSAGTPAFDGAANPDVLAGTDGLLGINDVLTITFTAVLDPNAAGAPATLDNLATGSGTDEAGTPTTDDSGGAAGGPGSPTPLTLAGDIGLIKSSVFNDESGDGFAQIGETISYTYTLTNLGFTPVSGITVTETGFTGAGPTPVPVLTAGDDGDSILQVTETWTYEVDYTLVEADITAGGVDNQATASGSAPDGTPLSDVSDSSNPADGDGTGTPGDGPDDGDVTSTSFAAAPIEARDDTRAAPVESTTGETGILNVFASNGSGADTLAGSPATAATTTVTPNAANPPPAGVTLNADGSVDVGPGLAPGPYSFDYDLCEIANPTNCSTATVSFTVGAGGIGVTKASVFNDQNGDGFAQVGETITYTYSVTNEGDFPLSGVGITETGFTGAGATPVASLTGGDDGDLLLETTETFIFTATYALIQADVDAGTVGNSATASGTTPEGTPVTDVSDSENPTDGDGTGTPGPGAGNDDPTTTPLAASTIVAQDDVEADPLDTTTALVGVVDIFADNGNGPDTLNGAPTDASAVTVSPDPTNPVPAGFTLNPDGTVDVDAGVAPGPYTFGYEICEIGNSANCDLATVSVTVGSGAIGVLKTAVFNDDITADGNAQVGETITYTYNVANEGTLPLDTVTLVETGFTGNGATPIPVLTAATDVGGDGILSVGESWTYTATYTLIGSDITDGVVDNQATASGDTPGGTSVSDLSDSTNPADGNGTGTSGTGAGNDDPSSTPLTTATIVANDDTLAAPIDASTPQTAVLDIFADNGAGPDTLNGVATDATAADVTVVPTAPPPAGITLNPDGTVDVAAGTPPGPYTFEYEICEILNPANCDTATVSLTVGGGGIGVVKSATFNDDVVADGAGQVGETISYTYLVSNEGDLDLSGVTLTETGFTGAGTTPTPVLTATTDVGGDGILSVGETWTYTATYSLVAADLAAGMVDNQATAAGTTPGGDTVSDLSDSSNPGDGDGTGTPGPGAGNDDPTSTPFTSATITANDDLLPDPVDATVAQPGILNVLTATGTGVADDLNGSVPSVGGGPTGVGITVVTPFTPIGGGPVPVLDTATGDVNVPAGTPAGTYTATYEICETLNPANCDTATVEFTVGAPDIGLLKSSVFNDENGDGFAQVDETISYTYTVTNEGDLPLSGVSVTEPAAGFTGAGTAPTPAFVGGDDGDGLLETGEIWFYSATYTLVAADITAGDVSNLASVSGTSPNGTVSSDLSDSQNPGDGDGTATAGPGAGNDDPTVTPLTSATIDAVDDSVSGVDGLTGTPGALNVLLDNGGGPDTLGGVATSIAAVDITVVTPAVAIDGGPVPVLDPATGAVDVPAGTPAGTYTITYEICETLNPDNCDEAVATVIVEAPEIIAMDDDFTAIPLDGAGGDVTPTVFTDDTLNGAPFAPADVTVSIDADGGLTGVTINPDGTINVPPGTPAGSYPVVYEICDVLNPLNCDTATATIQVGTIAAVAETFDTINGDAGGITPSVLTSDTLSGAPITDPADVILTVTGATGGLTLDPATNGIIVPAGTPSGTFTLTYEICDAANPTICSTVTETVTVGSIEAVAESFAPTPAGGTTAISVLASDTLNGAPATLANVSLTLVSADAPLTLNADGTITVAPGTAAGPFELTYEICDLANPTICSSVTETVQVTPEPSIVAVKTQTFVDDGDGIAGIGDLLEYTITVTNDGNVPLTGVTPTDTLTNGDGTVLTLDSGPTFVSSSAGSAEGTLAIGETATYAAAYTLTGPDVTSGLVSNTVLATGTPVPPLGFVGPPLADVSDVSDEGDPSNGDDDPTVFTFSALAFVDGLTVVKTAAVSSVQRGGVVPYTLVLTNANPAAAVGAVTVDTLPAGFVFVDGSATIDGVPTTTVDVVGRVISFPTVIVPAGGTLTIQLSARVLTGAPAGDATNRADLLDATTGERIAPTGTATVRVEPEAVFDCGDVIGKVYDDQNGNGYQDQGEPGLPSVRIAGVDGTIITTDEYGRYHVPCAALPETRGSNFILKVDERSLPTGYRVTTENPRVIRLTRGKMKELNFGASISRIVRVDINSKVFGMDDAGKLQLVPAFRSGVDKLLKRITDQPSTIRLAFHMPYEVTDSQRRTSRKMTRDVRRYIERRWRRIGDYKLNIETTYVRKK